MEDMKACFCCHSGRLVSMVAGSGQLLTLQLNRGPHSACGCRTDLLHAFATKCGNVGETWPDMSVFTVLELNNKARHLKF